MLIIPGVTLLEVPEHRDERGSLVVLEPDRGLPFVPARVFYMFGCSAARPRGEHATSCHLALVAGAGEVTVDVDNGLDTGSFTLDHRHHVLCIDAGVWLRLHDFAPETILVVAASASYAETTYFDAPQPQLLRVTQRRAA